MPKVRRATRRQAPTKFMPRPFAANARSTRAKVRAAALLAAQSTTSMSSSERTLHRWAMGAKRRRKSFRTCHLFTPIALLPVVRGVFGWSAGDRQDYGPPARVETKSRSASSPVLTEPALNRFRRVGPRLGVVSSGPWDVDEPPVMMADV